MDEIASYGESMEFRIVFDSIEATGKLTLYEAWTQGKGKDKITKQILQEKEIASVDFIVTNAIEVTDLRVEEEYRKKGLGRLIMNIIMALANYYDLPIELTSVDDAIPFYKKIGLKLKKGTKDVFIWHPHTWKSQS
jgi:GNAT superfamily N-acetyltransferase